jgi:elongation factor G
MADLNGRRGRVQGMDTAGIGTMVRAEVPMAEMLNYGSTLTSITQGRGSFRMDMDHYDVVPQQLAEKILAAAKRSESDDADS